MRRLMPVRPPPPAVRAAATGVSNTVVVDYYGFELHGLSPQERADREASAVRAARRSARWLPHAAEGQLPSPPAALRRFCRKGVPAELRGWAWYEASGARRRAELAGPGTFARLAAMAEERQPGVARQIDLDLPRTFPRNASVASRSGQQALRRILLASAARRPQQGYCQGLNFVAAMLLLAVEGSTGDPATSGSLDRCAERAFWLLDALLGCAAGAGGGVSSGGGALASPLAAVCTSDPGILYPGTFAPALEGCHVEMRAFAALLASKMPRLSRHLKKVGCDVSLMATDWFLCLLCTSLPSETCMRVWDALFADGHAKVLYRAALALLRRHEKALLAAEHPGEVLRAFRVGASHTHDRDALMRECWSARRVGRLPMAGIWKLREAALPGVAAMAAEREQRRSVGVGVGGGGGGIGGAAVGRGSGKVALRDVIEQGRKAQAQAMQREAAEAGAGGGGGWGSVLGVGGGGGAAAADGGGSNGFSAAAAASPAAAASAVTTRPTSASPTPSGGRLTPLLPHQQQQAQQIRRQQMTEDERWGASAWADDSERFGAPAAGR